MWAKILASFYLGLENLSEVEFKNNGLICSAGEISGQQNVQAGAEKAAVIA